VILKVKLSWFKHEEGEMNVKGIIGVVIVVLIALLMLPLVQSAVSTASDNATEQGQTTVATLLDMIPVFYVVGIILAVIAWVVHESGGWST